MSLDEAIHQHVAKLPDYLQAEVYDFVLFLEQQQKKAISRQSPMPSLNDGVIKLTLAEQEKFVQALLNPTLANTKLKKSVQNYQQKIHA